MWKLLLYILDLKVDLDLSILFNVSVLLFLGVSTVSLYVCVFSVLSTVSIFFFAEI